MKTKPLTKPTRCATGRRILKIRAALIKAIPHFGGDPLAEFYKIEGREWMRYCRHAAKCPACSTYETRHRAEQEKRFLASGAVTNSQETLI